MSGAARGGAALGALALLGLAACAPHTKAALRADGLPRRAEVAAVPFYPQEEYACGPASLAMVLAWSGLAVTPDDLVPQVYTPGRAGALASDVVAAARRHGRLAVLVARLDDVLAEVAAGHPVLVLQNLGLRWAPQWHFAVAIGYDLDAAEVTLHSGRDPRRVTPLATFERTWRRGERWALVVLPPDTLPRTAGETAVMQAAVGLERAGRPAEAATAYAGIARRWPDSHRPLVGLGNARYALDDHSGAEAAFREAIRRRPEDPAAWNNLAHALARQGRRAEAVAAAERAVGLGGPDIDRYRTTLGEVSGDQPMR